MDGGPGGREEIPVELQAPQLVAHAEDLAHYLLIHDPERLAHSAAVAERAKLLTAATSAEAAPFLVSAAWLHDIGYSHELRSTGFHPVDGGLYLRRTGWPEAMSALVAHHSGSRFVAAARGMTDELAPFAFVEDELTDALTVADQTAGPGGRLMTVDRRISDMLARHGPGSPNAQADGVRRPYLLSAARRVSARLEAAGVRCGDQGIF